MIKVLLAWPPYIPSYLNLCYHYTDFGEVAGYLKNQEDIEIKVLDGGVVNLLWSDFTKELTKNYDVLIIINHFDNIRDVRKLAEYSKEISPNTKILTYGRISAYIPEYFKKYLVDAIIYSGDWEIVIKKYLDFIQNKCRIKELSGLFIRKDNRWIKTKHGELLSQSKWSFPALDILPLNDYFKYEKELSFTISKGCPFNCIFCPVPHIQGIKDRRREINSALDFIEKAISKYNFDYVSMFSATFTFDREYVVRLCNEIRKRKMHFKWKCVTHPNCVDKELLTLMGKSGCFRISFGIETLEKNVQKNIGKYITEKRLGNIIKWCLNNDIQPLCFLMSGIPGETEKDITYATKKILSLGGKVRVTVYTPYHKLFSKMGEEEVMSFSKRIVHLDEIIKQ